MHKKFKMGKKILAVLLSAVVTSSVLPADFAVRMGQQAKAAETGAGIKDNDGYPLVYNRKGDDYIKAAGTPEQGEASRNIHKENYRNVSLPVTSYLYSEKNGSITRVEQMDTGILIENYDSENFSLLSKKTLGMELPLFGGFYAGENYNYIVFGQKNLEESNETEVYRVVQYDKNWNRISSDGLFGANTYAPFEAGGLRMCEYGDYLYVATCHLMYGSSDGIHHQSNVTLSFCQSAGKITDSYTGVSDVAFGYVSHSFNQFIKTDKTDLLALYHGDAYPRSIVLVKYTEPAGQEKYTGYCSYTDILKIPGPTGANYTGINVGGFEVSSDSYLTAYRSVDWENLLASGEYMSDVYNVYVGSLKKTGEGNNLSGTPDIIPVTSFAEEDVFSAGNPFLVKVSEDRFLLLWELCRGDRPIGKIQYVMLDSTGHMVSEVKEKEGALSDCQPVLQNGEVVWYVTDNKAPVFYVINPENLELRTINNGKPEIPVTYNMTLDTTELKNAEVTVDKKTDITASDIVTVTITPNSGYEFRNTPLVASVNAIARIVTQTVDGAYICRISDFIEDATVKLIGSAELIAITDTPAPTNTPAVTDTPVPTKTPEVTNTPTPTKTPEVTGTPVPTKPPIVTDTPAPTETPVVTDTPKPTETPAATGTPAPAETPKVTSTPKPTKTPTVSVPKKPAGWTSSGNQWYKGSKIYYIIKNTLYVSQFESYGTGDRSKVASWKLKDGQFLKIVHAYGNKIYVNRKDEMSGKCVLYSVDIKSKKKITASNHCSVEAACGKYLYGETSMVFDTGAYPVNIWKINGSSVKKVKTIGKYIFGTTVVKNKVYYASYPNKKQNDMTVYRCNLNGSHRKKLFRLKGKGKFCQVLISEVNEKKIIAYVRGNTTKRYEYTIKTGKLKKLN